ncbi:MAG: FAD-dependent thymidylate synthase, partial [candidate division WOR-3 bacterium]
DFEKFKDFLLRLKKAGHYSVFDHTPILVHTEKLSLQQKFELASTFFKVFWDEDSDLVLFNLRHIAENLSNEEFSELINTKPELQEIEVIFSRDYKVLYQGVLAEFDYSLISEENGFFVKPEVIVLKTRRERPFNWTGVIAHNFSRIFSHQFVRHTWLNFNQRSHRYTRTDSFVIPSAFSEEHKKLYIEVIQDGMEIYKRLEKEVKKEDARFVLPQGASTTVLATGPELVWKDFVEKRAIPQAQEEIRNLANFLNKVLFS